MNPTATLTCASGAPRVRTPPPLPRRGEHHDGVAPAQRGVLVGAIVAVHVAAGWGLLQIREVQDAVIEAAPMFVSLIRPAEPPKPVPVPPPPAARPLPRKAPAPPAIVAAPPTPSAAPPAYAVPEPAPQAPAPVQAAPAPAAPAPVVAAPVPAPAPAPAPAPKVIPASAVQYLEPITLEYPRASKRLGESGRVTIRVYIDEAGVAKSAQVERGSGHPRLDDAALAAVRKARFKPYTENGQAFAGWAYIPLEFELEK